MRILGKMESYGEEKRSKLEKFVNYAEPPIDI